MAARAKSKPLHDEEPHVVDGACVGRVGLCALTDCRAALEELAKLLNTGLDRQSVELILGLCEAGVNPDALSAAVAQIREQARAKGRE
jgi:hypothetical protein